MSHIRVVRSFIASSALAEIINQEYDLGGPATCKLFSKMLRTQDNDHYKVIAGGHKYVARVYQLGDHLRRQESDYEYELDWLNFLKGEGVPVSYPLPRKDGRFLGSLNAPEGQRYFALFSFAPGRPMEIDNDEQLFTLGAQMAKIHVISNQYQAPFARQKMDLDFLVDRPIARIKRAWGSDPDHLTDLDLLVMSAEEAKAEILEIINNPEHTPDGWGPIGGDFHSTNTFFSNDMSPTFFNFDLCGPGWRAYDIAAFLQNTNLINTSENLTEAFFAGYYSERPLSNNEHAAISPLLTIRRIWLTGTFTRDDVPVGYSFIAPA
ncbi:MAG: phosphotransferase [Chloroflexi bacterium]|nr:phosphotransferase [Chloroflexota bacterium]MBK7915512.1 phosphotransferase [Chloroflexota bacterium]MBK8933977.1 phosphotransferase [Chloroflexota bacterium]